MTPLIQITHKKHQLILLQPDAKQLNQDTLAKQRIFKQHISVANPEKLVKPVIQSLVTNQNKHMTIELAMTTNIV